jgi:ceramide glucosyltransferase
VRLAAGLVTAAFVLHDRDAARCWFLVPIRDFWGFAVWLAGLAGSTVDWRGQKLRLNRDGRIER